MRLKPTTPFLVLVFPLCFIALAPGCSNAGASGDDGGPGRLDASSDAGSPVDGGSALCSPMCVHGTCDEGSCTCETGYSGEACDVGDGTVYYVVQDEEPVADIVVAADAPNMVARAADLFRQYVEAMTGAALQVGHAPDEAYDFHVYIGSSEHTDALGVTSEGTEHGGFKIVAGDGHLVLLGDDAAFREDLGPSDEEWDSLTAPDTWRNTYPASRTHNEEYDLWEQDGRGSMNAVHAFLRDQGMRWYYPNELGTITPDKQDIAFPTLDRTVNPDFPMRGMYLIYKKFGHLKDSHYPTDHAYGSKDEHLDWILSLGINNTQEFVHGPFAHGLNAITERRETKEEHPEYYAVWGGTRMDGLDGRDMKQNLCSDGLLEETIRYAKTMFDTYDSEYVSIWPADGFTQVSQHSAECEAMATPERGRDGSLSDYVWDFINNVAWAIHDDPAYGPDKKIFAGAYTTYQLPPLELSDSRGMAPNISVVFTKWRTSTASETGKTRYQELTEEWIDLLPSGEVFTYDYYLHNRRGRTTESTPLFFPHVIAEDLRFLHGKSKGEFIEIMTNWPDWDLEHDTFAAQALNTYVTARLYWDVDQDVDALLDEYYELYFGPASEKMKALHEYSEDNYDLRFNPEYLSTMRSLAEEALELAGADTLYGRRITNLLDLMNSRYEGENVSVDSCRDLDSPGTTYTLSADVSSNDTCFFVDAIGVTVDCAGHTIEYAADGGSDDHGILIDASRTNRGHYFRIENCQIRDGSSSSGAAIRVEGADHGAIEDTNIDAGTGIRVFGAEQIVYRGNTVNAGGTAMYAQYGGSDGPRGLVSASTYEDNVFAGSSGYGAYLYRIDGDTITNNEFSSVSNNGLRLFAPVDTLLQGNTISSDSTDGLQVAEPTDLRMMDNTIVDN